MKRNYGIDMLKIISMFSIVLLHVLGKGGVLSKYSDLSGCWNIAWILEIIAYVAPNCYALASGYILWNQTTALKKLLFLWVQVVGLGIIVTGTLSFMDKSLVNLKEFVTLFVPISRGTYWYISAYFGMYIFIPVLNYAIKKMDREKYKIILISFIVLVILPHVILRSDPYGLQHGYSSIWLMYLYLFGAYISKYNITLDKIKIIVFIIICYLVTFLVKVLETQINIPFETGDGILIEYTSPTIILVSILWLLYFSQIDDNIYNKKRLIVKVSTSTLGIYIIHETPAFTRIIMERIVPNIFKVYAINEITLLLSLIGIVGMIFIGCLFVSILYSSALRLLRIDLVIEYILVLTVKMYDKIRNIL